MKISVYLQTPSNIAVGQAVSHGRRKARQTRLHAAACEESQCQDAEVVRAFYETPTPSISSKILQKQQKQIVEDICCSTKRIKKLAKKIEKACLNEKDELRKDMATAIQELQKRNVALEQLVAQMRTAGYEEESTSSSCSSDEECNMGVDKKKQRAKVIDVSTTGRTPMMEGQMDGAASSNTESNPLAALERGTVTVCTGKACQRTGQALLIEDALRGHFQGTSVAVECSKCMGMCKHAANVKVEGTDGEEVTLSGLRLGTLATLLPGLKVRELVS